MTDEPDAEEVWWEDGPVFSTTSRSSGIVSFAPGARPPRLRLLHPLLLTLGALLCGVCITIVLPGTLPPLLAATGWSAWNLLWWIPLALGAAGVLILLVPGTYALIEDEFRQPSAAIRGTTAMVAAGTALALLIWSGIVSGDAENFAASLAPILHWGSAVALVVAVAAALLFLSAAIRVQRVMAQIAALRERGRRFAGEVISVPDPDQWLLERPQFRVSVSFDDGTGARTVEAAMSTRPHRVPRRGSAVLVFVGDSGVHIEADPTHPMLFDANASRYTAPSGGGGN